MDKATIRETGLMHGQYVSGVQETTNSGCILEVFFTPDGSPSSLYRPACVKAKEFWDNLTSVQLRDGAFSIAPSGMSAEEYRQFVLTRATNDKDSAYLSDASASVPPLYVRVHALGILQQLLGEDDITQQSVAQWLTPDPETCELPIVPLQKLYEAIPRPPQSQAARHTLVFRPELWRVCPPPRMPTTAAAFDLVHQSFVEVKDAAHHRFGRFARLEASEAHDAKDGCCVQLLDDAPPLSRNNCWDVLLPALERDILEHRISGPMIRSVFELLRGFTPGMLKSLLQKCIRYGAVSVLMRTGWEVPAELVTALAFLLLAMHPGTFVPELGRFVTGMESACKRLGVCMVEDSYADPRWPTALFFVALSARQRFAPCSLRFLVDAARAAIATQADGRAYSAEAKQCAPMVRQPSLLVQAFNTLRSFAGDVALIHQLASGALRVQLVPRASRPAAMPLWHFVDQHCAPDVVYFLGTDAVHTSRTARSLPTPVTGRPFALHMSFLWEEGTSLNYRRHEQPHPHPAIGEAQRRYLHCLMPHLALLVKPRWQEVPAPDLQVSRGLHEATLAGLMPPVVANGFLTFLDPHDAGCTRTVPHSRKAVQDTVAQARVTPETEARGHEAFQQMLSKRPRVTHAPSGLDVTVSRRQSAQDEAVDATVPAKSAATKTTLKKATRVKATAAKTSCVAPTTSNELVVSDVNEDDADDAADDGGNHRRTAKRVRTWEEARQELCHVAAAVMEGTESLSLDAVCAIAATPRERTDPRWRTLLQSAVLDRVPAAGLARIGMYLSTTQYHIAPFRVSRDGGSVYQQVHRDDGWFMVFLLHCALWLPTALCLVNHGSGSGGHSSLRFLVRHHGLWEEVRAMVRTALAAQRQLDTPAMELMDIDESMLVTWQQLCRKATTYRQMDSLQREPKPHQLECIEHMRERKAKGERGTVFWSPVGSGKTYTVLAAMISWMLEQRMPAFVVFTLPPGAMASITHEVEAFGLPVCVLNPTQAASGRGAADRCRLRPYCVNLVAHDHLRHDRVKSQILLHASQLFLVVDEVHLFMSSNTKRTSTGLELCKTVAGFVAMTGTMIRDQHATGVAEWLAQIVPFEVSSRNLFVALACAVSNRVEYGIEERHVQIDVPMTAKEKAAYVQLVSADLGGVATETQPREAFALCYRVLERALVEEAVRRVAQEPTILLVARDHDMMMRIDAALRSEGVRTFTIYTNHTIDLRADTPSDIQVVLTTMHHVTGYTLTRARTLVTGVYFSNQCTRTQMIGRILRTGQLSPVVEIVTMHCGLLSYTLQHYNQARSLEAAISQLAHEATAW